ncbi:MAG: D-aminoacyl-tRNA deacylase [Nitriliruptoraceae bacterium]
MRALVQRVVHAAVTSAPGSHGPWEETGRIGAGLVALVGVTHDDTEGDARTLADKLFHLRILPDDAGAMNRSCAETGAALLVVPQFTLYADTRRGRRPSFVDAAAPEVAEPLLEALTARLRANGASVATGRFRTHMRVELTNDGPVTMLLEV